MAIPTTDMLHGDWCYCPRCIANSKPATEELIALRSAATCSRLRETPETDQQSLRPETAALAGADLVVTAAFAKRLERERDEARQVIRVAAVLIAAKGRHNTMLAYGGLRAAMPSEND